MLSIGVGAYMLEPSGFGVSFAVSAVYRCSSLHVGAVGAMLSVLSRCSSLHVGAISFAGQCCVGVGAYMLEPSGLCCQCCL